MKISSQNYATSEELFKISLNMLTNIFYMQKHAGI